MGFNKLRDLTRRGFIPKEVANDQKVRCPACQQGKVVQSSSEKEKEK